MPTKPLPLVPLLLLAGVYVFLVWLVVWLLRQPARFIRYFLEWPYRSWGIRISIENHAALARRARVLGWLMLAFTTVHGTLVFGTILGSR